MRAGCERAKPNHREDQGRAVQAEAHCCACARFPAVEIEQHRADHREITQVLELQHRKCPTCTGSTQQRTAVGAGCRAVVLGNGRGCVGG